MVSNQTSYSKTEIFWLALFLSLCVTFICVKISSPGIQSTLQLLLLISASRAFISTGLLSRDHIPAIKALLFNICFPFIIFKSVADSNPHDIPKYAALSGVAFLQDFLSLFFVGWTMYGFVKVKAMKLAEAVAVVFSMSAVATMSTGMPFAKMISKEAQTKLVFMDQGNKIWILVVVYIIIVTIFGKNDEGWRKMAKDIGYKIATNPLIIGFVLGFICLGPQYNMKKLGLTGQMASTFAELTNTMTMIFIGMKLEIPQDPKPFLPICLRRGFGMLFVAAAVPLFKLSTIDFKTLIIYVSAGSSLFPYVYFKNIAPGDERVDTEYLFQTVTYDYFAAIVVNSVISLGTVTTAMHAMYVGCGFFVIAAILGLVSLQLQMRHVKEDEVIEIAGTELSHKKEDEVKPSDLGTV